MQKGPKQNTPSPYTFLLESQHCDDWTHEWPEWHGSALPITPSMQSSYSRGIHSRRSKLPHSPLAHPRRQQVPFLIIDLLFATSYLRAMFTPPGEGRDVKSRRSRLHKDERGKRCYDCCEQKPDRTHHCSKCQVGKLVTFHFPLPLPSGSE